MKRVIAALLILLAVLTVALWYADARLREIVEREATARLQDALPQARDPSVTIESFPFVGKVLWNGRVERLRVAVGQLHSSGITLRQVRLDVFGLQIDRDRLLDERQLAVTGIDRARISARIAGDDVAQLVQVPVSVRDGRVEVQYDGQTYQGSGIISNRLIILNVEGFPPLVVPLPEFEVLPCQPSLELVDDHLEIACSTTTLPPAVAKVLR